MTAADGGPEGTYDNPAVLLRSATPLTRPLSLPNELQRRFDIVGELPAQGTEAVLLLVTRRPQGDEAVLKWYGRPLDSRTDVLTRIRDEAYPHVVSLLDYGTVDGSGYEVLEWIQAGTLRTFVDGQPGPLAGDAALAVTRELSEAIHAFHRLAPPAELAHGDITPDNILVRATRPLDLVLADFGRATTNENAQGVVHPHPRWSSPGDAVTSPEGDWWSLGCIVYWFRTGRVPFHDLTERGAIVKRKESRDRFPADDVPNESGRDWAHLVRGLTTFDSRDRWGHSEVQGWLDGALPDLGDEWNDPAPVVVQVATERQLDPIRFDGRDFASLAELAVGLAARWDEACQHLDSVEGNANLRRSLLRYAEEMSDLDLTADIPAILDAPESADHRLARLLTRLDPTLPASFRGYDLSRVGLGRLCDRAAEHRNGREAESIRRLAEGRVLSGFEASGRDVDYGDLQRQWDDEIGSWQRTLDAHRPSVSDDEWTYARARVLHAFADPAQRTRLSSQGRRASRRSTRAVDWYAELRSQASHPGVAVALIQLAPWAERAATQLEAAEAAERDEDQQRRRAASDLRFPRTRRCLAWMLPAAALLALGALVLHLLPQWGISPFTEPRTWLSWWSRTVPYGLRPWLATATLPALTLPSLAVAILLWWRAPRTAGDARRRRHPLERRASQAVIAYVTLLVPVLIPVTALGWTNGLRLYAADGLYRPRAIRTLALLVGTVGLTGCALALWQLPALQGIASGGWAWNYRAAQAALETPQPEWLLAPWWLATLTTFQADGAEEYTTATAVLGLSCLALLGLGGLGYLRWNAWIATAAAALLIPGTVAALNALFAYGLLGQHVLIDAAYAFALVLLIRHRLRNRNRQRPQGEQT